MRTSKNGDPCSPEASCSEDDSCSIFEAFIIPSAASAGGFPDLCTFLCAKKAHEDYGEDLRKAICYVNGGGAIATPGG